MTDLAESREINSHYFGEPSFLLLLLFRIYFGNVVLQIIIVIIQCYTCYTVYPVQELHTHRQLRFIPLIHACVCVTLNTTVAMFGRRQN